MEWGSIENLIHAAERFGIHYFASFGVLFAAYFASRFAFRKLKWWKKWVGPIHTQPVVLGIVSILWVGPWEIWNTITGSNQVWWKAYTDQLSWISGIGTAIWANHRMYWMMTEDRHQAAATSVEEK